MRSVPVIPSASSCALNPPVLSKRDASKGFTIVEVMMASVILVVGFMGVISAITVGSEMLATARRQTIASQLIADEIERLRLESWTTVDALPTTTTWSSGASYIVGSTTRYNGGWYRCIVAHTASASITPLSAKYWAAYMTYAVTNTYYRGDVVYYATNRTWYRYINSTPASGTTPTNTTYWAAYTGPIANTGVSDGATFTITRNVIDVTSDLCEIEFVVSWAKSGTTTAASAPSGAWLNRLAFFDQSPIARTQTRAVTVFIGKYGMVNSYQRS